MGCDDDGITTCLDACMKCGKLFEPVFKNWTQTATPKGKTICADCARPEPHPNESKGKSQKTDPAYV